MSQDLGRIEDFILQDNSRLEDAPGVVGSPEDDMYGSHGMMPGFGPEGDFTSSLDEVSGFDLHVGDNAVGQWPESDLSASGDALFLDDPTLNFAPGEEGTLLWDSNGNNASIENLLPLPTFLPSESPGVAPDAANVLHDSRSITVPKIGTRFSRDSLRILKQWFAAHSHNPYPDEKTKEKLQILTGLNKTQIANWLANARRRTKTKAGPQYIPPKASHVQVEPIEVPKRTGTPLPRSSSSPNQQNPMQRWMDSPPEEEAADASAIARAVAAGNPDSSVGAKGNTRLPHNYRLVDSSSGSSAGSSSMGSASSAYSNKSTGPDILGCARPRRRKRTKRRSRFITPAPFACTFCTETFRRKHDWQRHETSIHLSLERWRCSPDGPVALNPANDKMCCVFCSEPEPAQTHVNGHNPEACQEHTFSRKDHLKQHIKLVHRANFVDWSMTPWKVSLSQVRSRCGICGKILDTWSERIEHLTEHFKIGHTMASWEGDWGFEEPILQMVENAIPPYLIHDERNTPFPFEGSGAPATSPRSAYELITLELIYFVQVFYEDHETVPSNESIQLEACRIVFASEMQSLSDSTDHDPPASWLRDLITSKAEITQQAQFLPIRSPRESRLPMLKINGKRSLFDDCPLEQGLRTFVQMKKNLSNLILQDHELQQAACKLIQEMEQSYRTEHSNIITNWLIRSICESSNWLNAFKRRFDISFVDYSGTPNALPYFNSNNLNVNDVTTSSTGQISLDYGNTTNTAIFDTDPSQVHALGAESVSGVMPSFNDLPDPTSFPTIETDYQPTWGQTGLFMLNDSTYQERLSRTLSRWVMSQMSPRNPNRHVPTDAEIQHQARFMAYGDDDPWNQTPADVPEWLERLKRKTGILPP